jgi:hypothetical protein
MNRLDDSMKLFDWLCSNPMLRKAGIVLFLSARFLACHHCSA